MTDIRRCTIAELEAAPNLAEVLDAYGNESAAPELGKPNPQVASYRALEAAGIFHPIAAFDGDRLVGFILPIMGALPHYGVMAATVESFFVLKAERKKGIGLRLLSFAESTVRDMGAKAFMVSAPTSGPLGRVLAAKHYRHSNDGFLKALA